jgi:hypothetical protein
MQGIHFFLKPHLLESLRFFSLAIGCCKTQKAEGSGGAEAYNQANRSAASRYFGGIQMNAE